MLLAVKLRYGFVNVTTHYHLVTHMNIIHNTRSFSTVHRFILLVLSNHSCSLRIGYWQSRDSTCLFVYTKWIAKCIPRKVKRSIETMERVLHLLSVVCFPMLLNTPEWFWFHSILGTLSTKPRDFQSHLIPWSTLHRVEFCLNALHVRQCGEYSCRSIHVLLKL